MPTLNELSHLMNSPHMLNLRRYGYGSGDELQVTDIADAIAIADWLKSMPQTHTPKANSYALKHIAEKALGAYVPNGVLIFAAILAGCNIRSIPRSPNALIGVKL